MRIRDSAAYAAMHAGAAADSVQNTADWFGHLAILAVEILADVQEDGILLDLALDPPADGAGLLDGLGLDLDKLPAELRDLLPKLRPILQKILGQLKLRIRLGEADAEPATETTET